VFFCLPLAVANLVGLAVLAAVVLSNPRGVSSPHRPRNHPPPKNNRRLTHPSDDSPIRLLSLTHPPRSATAAPSRRPTCPQPWKPSSRRSRRRSRGAPPPARRRLRGGSPPPQIWGTTWGWRLLRCGVGLGCGEECMAGGTEMYNTEMCNKTRSTCRSMHLNFKTLDPEPKPQPRVPNPQPDAPTPNNATPIGSRRSSAPPPPPKRSRRCRTTPPPPCRASPSPMTPPLTAHPPPTPPHPPTPARAGAPPRPRRAAPPPPPRAQT